MPNVTVSTFDGLTADYARQMQATIIVRGLRAVTDFEYELQIAQTNHVVESSGRYDFPDDESEIFIPEFHDREGGCLLRRGYLEICTGSGCSKSI